MRMNRLSMVVIIFCAALMAAMYQPFMAVWVKDDPSLMRHALTPALMVLYFYIMQSRQMLLAFKSAASLWKQDRWKPIVAGAVNLGSNILFVVFLPDAYKLDGVIFSTILGFAFIQIPWESHVGFSAFFGKAESRAYWRSYAGFSVCALALCAVAYLAARVVPIGGIPGLFAKAVAATAATALCMALVFRGDLATILGKLRKRSET